MCYYKFGFLFLSLMMLFSVSNAVMLTFQLNLNNEDETLSNGAQLAHIHFGVGGNDFGGLIVWGGRDDKAPGDIIGASTEEVDCARRMKGLYYNSQRGDRLWPLDEDTSEALGFSGQGLEMSGGLYTNCTSGTVNGQTGGDSLGFYGVLYHRFQGNDYTLLAGVKYTGNVNTVLPDSSLAPTFQRFDSQYPLGLLYDYNGGIGFVGCQFNGTDKNKMDEIIDILNETGVNNFFIFSGDGKPVPMTGYQDALDCSMAKMSLDQLLLFKIQGIIGMSSDASKDLASLAGEQANDSKTQYFSTVNVNNATLVNVAKRKAEELCRGKWSNSNNVLLNVLLNQEIICIQGDINLDISDIEGKTVIVQGDLILGGSMGQGDAALDIFVDKGKLTLPGDSRKGFDEKGYPSDDSSVSSGVFFKGNFIINGLVKVAVAPLPKKYYIHGKFTSLNTYAAPEVNRITQVQNLLGNTTGDDIDLTKVFQWRCGYSGSGSDGSNCQTGEFRNAPLVIINQNYPSKLLQ